MSALTTTTAGSPADALSPIRFGRLARVELRKLTDTRASRWLLIAIIAATPIVLAVMLAVTAPRDLTYNRLVDYTQTPQKLLLPALGILSVTSEWSQRTGLVTFTLVPNRRRVLLAKAAATLGLGLLVIAVAFAAAAAGNLLTGLRHGDGSWAFGAQGFGEIALLQVSALLQGLAFGMLLRSSAAAIVAYYVVPSVWTLLFSLTSGLKQVAPWVDLDKAQNPLYTHQITGTGWLQLLSAASIWILLPLAAGTVRAPRGEITSA
ncbi:MAG TPA: ABC transporter permease [Trebonia sp.]